MLKHLIICIFSICFLDSFALSCDKHKAADSSLVEDVEKYKIDFPKNLAMGSVLSNPGIGSGLTYKGKDKYGNFLFYSVTDRGVNFNDAKLSGNREGAVFLNPKFKPFISEIKLTPGKRAEIISVIDLGRTGLPPHLTPMIIPLSSNLDILEFDPNGIDSEAIDLDKNGNFWIADEYRPALLQFSPKGKMLQQIDLNNYLPEVLKHKMSNRGIESLVVTPSGKLVFTIESILDIDSKTHKTAEFIRVVEYDLATQKSKIFAYSFDFEKYADRANVKIGDIAAIDDNNFLFIEQGKSSSGEFINDIYIINTEDATDITSLRHSDDGHLEFGPVSGLIEFPLKKRKLLSMRDHGWTHEKLEGLAFIDNKTIALINDNDFGFEAEIMGEKGAMIKTFDIDLEKKTLFKNGKGGKVDIKMHDNPETKTEIWLIKLKNPINCK